MTRSHTVVALLLIAIAVLVGSACRGDCSSDSKLALRVATFCNQIRWDVDQALSTYQKAAPALDDNQLSPRQRQRIETTLAVDSIGVTAGVRNARLRDIANGVNFCANARRIDDTHLADIEQRLQKLVEQLNADFDGVVPNHKTTAALLADLDELVHEVDAAPYLH